MKHRWKATEYYADPLAAIETAKTVRTPTFDSASSPVSAQPGKKSWSQAVASWISAAPARGLLVAVATGAVIGLLVKRR